MVRLRLGLCAETLLLISLVSSQLIVTGAELRDDQPVAQYSCEEIEQIPKDQQCSFIKAECEAESRIPYTQWYYCHIAPWGIIAKVPFVMLLLVLLPLLFTALGDTAELYFSPTMAIVSQTIPGMRPRFAGVTFVALANGAPDLSANISALRTGQVALSAGAFTGAAMFVQCVVASEVIRISKGVRCRGATLRDVGVYALCVTGVCLALHSGKVTRWFVAGTVLTYALYVLWVFLGDEWHARGRPELRPGLGMSWQELRRVLLERQHRRQQGDISIEPYEGFTALPTTSGNQDTTEALLPWVPIDEPAADAPAARRGYAPVMADASELPQRAPQVATWVAAAGAAADAETGMTHFPDPRTPVAAPLIAVDSMHEQDAGTSPLLQSPASAPAGPTGTGPHTQTPQRKQSGDGHGSGVLAARTYKQAVWADLAWEPSGRGRRQLAVELRNGLPPLRTRHSDSHTHAVPDTELQQPHSPGSPRLPLHATALTPRAAAAASPRRVASPGQQVLQEPATSLQQTQQQQAGESDLAGSQTWKQQAWQTVCEELTFGTSSEWDTWPEWRQRLRHISFCLLLPVYGALRLTVPMADPETYNQQWLVVSVLCCPLGILVYFEQVTVGAVVGAMVTGLVLAAVMHWLTTDEMEMPSLDCGTGFAFGPALVSLAGFFMGVLWIDSLASEVVGVISLLSGLLHLPPSLVGLTLLTWGNSLGDYFGNQALAKRGASSTALTACFASPLFNMLLSMALGFSAYFAKEGVSSAPVSLPADAALGCVALVIYNAVLATVGLMNKFCLPARFYLFARVWYGLYLVAAIAMAFL